MNASQTVRDALLRSAAMAHVVKAFVTRNPGPESEGSTFLEPQSIESLSAAEWEPASDDAIKAPAVGFVAQIPGFLGIVAMDQLDPEAPCKMTLGHKGTVPFVSAVIERSSLPGELQKVPFTTMLLGPGDGGELVVWTFFPGGAVPPSTMEPSDATEAVRTVADAVALGFGYAKVAG